MKREQHDLLRDLKSAGVKRDEIARALRVSASAISNYRNGDQLPAAWYAELKAICDQHCVPCHFRYFSFVVSQETEAAE